jgi:hypothetical protein
MRQEELNIKNSGQKKCRKKGGGGGGVTMNANLNEMWMKERLHFVQLFQENISSNM